MVDLKAIYEELDKMTKEKREENSDIGVIQRACLPIIMKGLKLYHEEISKKQDQK